MLTSSLSVAAGGGTATNNTITATGDTSGGHNRLTTIQDRIQMMKKRLANLNESLDNVTGGDSANTSSYISGIGGGGGGERRQSHHSRHGRAASDTMGLQHAGAREKESVGRIAADSVHNLHHREHEDGSWTEKQQQQPSRHQHEQHWQHQQQQQQRRGTAEPTSRVPSSSPDLYRSSSSYLNNDHRHEGGEDRQQYHEPYRHHHQQYNMSGGREWEENLPTTEEDSYLDRSVSSTTVGGALSNAPSYLGGRNTGNNNAAARRSPSAHNNTNHNAGNHINVNSSEYQYNLRQASMSMGGGAGSSGRVASGYMYDGYNSNHHHNNTNRGGGGGAKNTADAFYRAPSADRMGEGVGGGGVSTVVSRMTSVSVPRPNNAIWATEEGGPSFPSSSSTQSAGVGDRGNGTTVVLPQPTPLLHTNSMRGTAPRLSQRSERNRGTIDNGEEEEEEESSSNQALLIATLLKQQDEMRRAMEEQAAALKALTSSSSSAVRSSPQKQKGRALYQEERDGSTAEDFISDDGRRGAEPSRSPSPPLASRERLIKSANHKDFSPSFVPQGASDEDESKEGPGNPSSKAPVKGDSREHQGMSLEEMQQTLRERLASSQQQRHLRQRGQPKSEATYDDNDDDDQEEVNYDDDEEEKKDSVSGSYGGKAVKGSEERGGGNSDRALGSSKASAMASIKQQKSAGTSSFPTSSFALPSKSAKRSASPSANSNSHPANSHRVNKKGDATFVTSEEQHNSPRGGGGGAGQTSDVERTQQRGQPTGKGVGEGKGGIADSKDTPHLMTAMTGAEVFAVLRLRGLIASRGDTGERLLPQSRCHSMALSENELSQLEELRESLAMMMMMASTSSSNNTNNSNPTTAVIPPSRSYSQANATQQNNENRSRSSSTGGRPAVRDGAGAEPNSFVGSAPLNVRRSATLHQLESSRSASNQSRRSHSPNLSERSNALRGPATSISGTSAPLPRRPPSSSPSHSSVRSMSSASQSMNVQHQTPAHFGAQSMHKNTKDDSGMRMAPTPTPIVAGNSLYVTNNMQKRNSGGSTRESVHM